ncbi:hypothetical protein GCM10010145_31990 [Streptomyces ruber]|uniref:Secreted protein n=3 Tax=Streptomyces TaxID=1883 RepID=A0A918BCL9_9ACTN|nr:hypothetical protein GCM10010145_31990 [Streptomyces ruber]
MVAAVGLAASIAGLTVPAAHAIDAGDAAGLAPVALLDTLTVAKLPAEYRNVIPLPSSQVQGLDRLNDLGQLQQLVAPAAPLLGLVPAFG